MTFFRISALGFLATLLSGCITASVQGYADRQLPARPMTHMAALVIAPGPLAGSMLSSISGEASKRGIVADDALKLFPPTRVYTDAEVRRGLSDQAVDGVLIINVGDTGVIREYAGTVFSADYSGSSTGVANVSTLGGMSTGSGTGVSHGTMTGSATPSYHYTRQMNFVARLIEPATGRMLWIGQGQVNAAGALFVRDSASASRSISAIFDDLRKNGLLGA